MPDRHRGGLLCLPTLTLPTHILHLLVLLGRRECRCGLGRQRVLLLLILRWPERLDLLEHGVGELTVEKQRVVRVLSIVVLAMIAAR